MAAEDDLETAVQRVQAGEVDAYRSVINACELRVRLVIAAVLPEKEGVEDVAQEVFLKAYQKLHEYQPGTDFRAWISTFARQLSYNERKRQLRRIAMKSRYRAQIGELCTPEVEASANPVTDELLLALHSCQGELQGHARKILDEYYVAGRSCVELARSYEREEGWVRLVLFRARRAILECMKRKGALLHG